MAAFYRSCFRFTYRPKITRLYIYRPDKKNGISYSLSPYCQMKMKKRKKKKKNTRKMKNLAKIHRIHEKSRECEENWKWNKAHVVTLPATWAWICMLSLYVNEWLTPNTELLYQFLIAFFRICVGDYFCKWFYCFLYESDFFLQYFFFHSLWNSEKTTFIRSICKHLEHFSFKHDLFAFICIHWKYSALDWRRR